MAILIDPKGMLEGKRLRKLSYMARLYYFQTLAMTNFYARLEMDADLIALKLAIIKDPTLTNIIIEGYFEEYVNAGLCMKYTADGAEWVQYDTPLKMRAEYPSNADNASPAPPEPAYTDWLKSLHESKWADYYMTGYKQSISEKRAAAGRSGGIQSGITRSNPEAKPKQEEAKSGVLPLLQAKEPVVVDVDVNVIEDVGVDVDVVVPSLSIEGNEQRRIDNDSISSLSSKTKNNDNDSEFPSDLDECAKRLTNIFDHLVSFNPKEDASSRPKAWRELWEKDFRLALASYTPEDIESIIILSQAGHNQRYYVRPAGLVKSAASLLEQVNKMRKDQRKMWCSLLLKYSKNMASSSSAKEGVLPNTPPSPQFNSEDDTDEADSSTFTYCEKCGKRNDTEIYANPVNGVKDCRCFEDLSDEELAFLTQGKPATKFNIEDDDDEFA